MRRRVWARLSRLGVREDDPSTWSAAVLTGLSKSIKRDAVFTATGSPAVTGAVDHLLGPGEWIRPPDWGTILVTFPGLPEPGRPWTLPARSWHTDYGFDLDPVPLPGVKVFAFISDVGPRGGGTLAIAGSHRVVARYARSVSPDYRRDRHVMERFLRHDDWFRALSRPGGDPGRTGRFMDRDHQAGGITVRVTELTGNAIRQVPAGAWKPGTRQDGRAEDDKDVAEITGLMTRAGNWPEGLRWIARRVKPSRRHLRNLTDYEKKTGWKYSITCTNIPDTGIKDVPGSHHPQYIDTIHREHAIVETAGVRTAKAMGLRNLPSKHGRSTRAGSSRRTSPPTWPPGPASSAFTTIRTCGKPTRTRSATGSGTSPPGSPAMPASASSRSAQTGPGRTRSSPAGSGYAPCQHPPDQHKPPRQRERRTIPAPSEPVRSRAPRAPSPARHQRQTGTKPETGHQHNQ